MKIPAVAPCEQPPVIEFETVDHVFIKTLLLKRKGMVVPQHAHVYDHAHMLARGSMRVWKDGVYDRDYVAPCCITITKGVMHTLMSLEDMTIGYCIHNTMRKEIVEILAENHTMEPV